MSPLPSPLPIVLLISLLASLVSAAGHSSAKCNDTSVLAWASNKEGQDPCQIAANLNAVCAPSGEYDIAPLTPAYGSYYIPSTKPTFCECSSVLYSLTAACGLCQGAGYTNWPTWITNCTAVSPGTFPASIPPGTFVPKWAYMDVQTTKAFDPAKAQSIGVLPESSATPAPPPTASSSSNQATSTGSDGSQGSTQTPSEISSSSPSASSSPASPSSNHAGAIAGGVVGCIIGLALVAGIVFFLVNRSKRRRISVISPPIMQNEDKDYPIASPYHSSPHLETHSNTHSHSNSNHVQVMNITHSNRSSPHRPYDPNDPTTFPHTPASSSHSPHQSPRHSPHAGPPRTYNYTPPHSNAPRPYTGAYSGFAEI